MDICVTRIAIRALLYCGLLNSQLLNLIQHTQTILNELEEVLTIIDILEIRSSHQNTWHSRKVDLKVLITILIKSKVLQKEVDVIADIVTRHLIRLMRKRITLISVSNLEDTILQVLHNANGIIKRKNLGILHEVNNNRSVRVSHGNGMLSYTAAMDSIFAAAYCCL
jgi:hypothetical protein